MVTVTNPIKNSNEKLKTYVNKGDYSNATKRLRTIFKNECIIIPYTIYFQKVKEHLPAKYNRILDEYKELTYSINKYKRDTSKCYDKNLVSYLKKLYKFQSNPEKLKIELSRKENGKYVLREQYKPFIEPNYEEYNEYRRYIDKGWKNHPVYIGAKRYYEELERRKKIKNLYNTLYDKILDKCKYLWFKNYEKNSKKINKKAQEEFWILARGLVISTIKQLYTIDIPDNINEIVDETLGRVYEGLMCFYDSNYKIDTFIYSITMSKISSYDRARAKREDAPELFHNMDDVEIIHDYYGFANPKLNTILVKENNIFIERHENWLNAIKESLIYG